MNDKRIMVLGAGRGQLGLINAIKRDGHTCIVASIKGNYPGIELADEFCEVDITDIKAVAKAVRKYNIDAVTTCCLDTGISALGYACKENGLIGLSPQSAEISNDKFLMKSAFIKNGVNTAKYKKVSAQTEIADIINEFSFPMIVKAVDLQGSKGIYIANNESELYSGFRKTMADTKRNFCIIEEFLVGEEFGAQSFVVDGQILYVMPTGDITYLSATNIPVGHYVPFEVSKELNEKIEEQVKLAIKSVGLDNCAVNIDLILKDNKVYVIELTGRVGANCLPELSSIYYGYDVYKMIYLTALGESSVDYYNNTKANNYTPCYAKMLFSESSGILKKIVNNNDLSDPNIYEISFFVKEGEKISKFTNSKDCLGQVIVKGKNLTECKLLIDEVINNIQFVLEDN